MAARFVSFLPNLLSAVFWRDGRLLSAVHRLVVALLVEGKKRERERVSEREEEEEEEAMRPFVRAGRRGLYIVFILLRGGLV